MDHIDRKERLRKEAEFGDAFDKVDLMNDEPSRVKPKPSKRRADHKDEVEVKDPVQQEEPKKSDDDGDLGDLAKAVKDLSDKWDSHKDGKEEKGKKLTQQQQPMKNEKNADKKEEE